jgi:hypothetical protein
MKVKVLGPSKGYIDLLNEATTAKSTADKAQGKDFQKTPIRPSASGACTRELFYQLMQFHGKAKYETEVDAPETTRLFALGHSIESHIIRQFEVLKDVFEIRYKQQVLSFAYLEAKQDPKMSQWLEGSLDLVFWSEKYKCVADVKSKKDKFSQFYKTAWDEYSEKLATMKTVTVIHNDDEGAPTSFWVEDLEAFLDELNDPFFAANFLQLNLYANSDFLKERGIDHGAILQYSKNDSRLREVRFKPSAALAQKVIGKFQTALDAAAADDESLAPRDYVLGSIKCAFCKYKAECWPANDPKKAFFNTLPKKDWPKDTDRMGPAGQEIEKLFESYSSASQAESEKARAETKILKQMMDKGVSKIRLDNGDVYIAKKLKDSVVLRRSKV